jgi:hypothetical protein
MQKYKHEEFLQMNERAFASLLKIINGEEIDDIPLIDIRDASGKKRPKMRIDAAEALSAFSEDSADLAVDEQESELGGGDHVPLEDPALMVSDRDSIVVSLDAESDHPVTESNLDRSVADELSKTNSVSSGDEIAEGNENTQFLDSNQTSLWSFFPGLIHLVGITALYYLLYLMYTCMA